MVSDFLDAMAMLSGRAMWSGNDVQMQVSLQGITVGRLKTEGAVPECLVQFRCSAL